MAIPNRDRIIQVVCDATAKRFRRKMVERPDVGWEDLAQIAKTRCYKYIQLTPKDCPEGHIVQICTLKAKCAIIDYLRPIANKKAEAAVIAERVRTSKRGKLDPVSLRHERFDSRRYLINFLGHIGDIASETIPASGVHNAIAPRTMCVLLCLRNYLRLSYKATLQYANDDPAIRELCRGKLPQLCTLHTWSKLYDRGIPTLCDLAIKRIRKVETDGD